MSVALDRGRWRLRRRTAPDGASSLQLIGRLLALARPYRGQLSLALVALLAETALALAGPVMMQFLVDAIQPGADPSLLGRTTLIIIGILMGQGLAMLARSYLLDRTGLRVISDLRLRLFEHLQTLSLRFFGERRTGELVSRVLNDTWVLRSALSEDLASGVAHSLSFFGAMALVLYINWRLTLFMALLVPVVSLSSAVLGRRVRKLSYRVQEETAQVTTVVEEAIGGVRIVQSFGREPYEQDRFRQRVESTFQTALQRTRIQLLSGPIISVFFLAVVISIIWFGGRDVLSGRMSTGQLVTFIILMMNMSGSLRRVSGLWNNLQQAIGSSERLFELLETEPDIRDLPDAVPLSRAEGRITFEGVFFSYQEPGQEAAPRVLDGVSFDVPPGQVIALVGPSGAGKTTLLNLIPRFYDPVEGRILLDGADLRSLTLRSLREQIGIVPQETHLFGGTVRENLLYGRLEAMEAEMIEAAKAANAHEFIARLPLGYDTVVGERGVKLSGGQRQRIAIARALLKDPRILLLDEATSALDSESEGLVQEALERLMAGRTSLVIAHRLSTVQRAHRIAVLEAGRLVELGSHEELMALGGLYARLYRLQFKIPEAAS